MKLTQHINKSIEYDRSQWPVFSFAGGPTQLSRTVFSEINRNFLNFRGTGKSVLEVSNNLKEFHEVYQSAEQDIRSLYDLPSNFRIFFSHGGATLIFEALIYNLLGDKSTVSYANTGHWSEKAIKEAVYNAKVHEPIKTLQNEQGKWYIPKFEEWNYNSDSAYLHYCDNETVEGIEFNFTPKFNDQILITDVSSNFLTRHMDWNKLDILYSHGQKNVGIAGSSITIIKEELLSQKKLKETPYMCDFEQLRNTNGALNALPVLPIYVNSLMFRYIKETGGIDFWDEHSKRRSSKIYEVIDKSHGFYINEIVKEQRSRISIAFNLRDEAELQEKFFNEAAAEGIVEIKGHRSKGGCRICLYIPISDLGLDLLVDFMQRFAEKYNSI